MFSRKLWFVLVVVLGCSVLFIAGCDIQGCSMKEVTVTIQPVHILSMYDTQDDYPWFCSPAPVGTGPFDVSPTEVVVGYSHTYFSGWPCWEHINQIYQGAVWFPVKETIGSNLVKSARLKFNLTRSSTTIGQTNCAVKLCRVDEDSWWNRGRHGLTSYSDCISPVQPSGGSLSLDVSTAVQDWVYGRAVNNGFVLIGAIENFNGFSDDGMLTRQECATWFSNFSLEVTFFQKGP